MKAIISFFLAIIFAIEGFFAGLFKKNEIPVTTEETKTEFYCDGQSENGLLRYGVAGDINLFAPDEEIKIIVECNDSSLYGTKAKLSVESDQTGFGKSEIFDFGEESAQYAFTFSSSLNGIYDITLKTTDGGTYTFSVGIIPENSVASTDFYYGIQPYITRAQCWGEDYRIPGLDAENSIDAILDTAEYMGVNLVREDGVAWSGMQTSAYGDVDFSTQDYLIDKVTSRGMKYNWILGSGTTEWSVSANYKDSYDPTMLWAYAPDEDIWEDYVSKLEDHYAADENILWEIWNEPNIDFFIGTQEEYFTLLENTAKILKSRNSGTYVYSGGLAYAERESNKSYFSEDAELIKAGLLDNWGYHNHDGSNQYCDNVNTMLSNASSAGLTGGGLNSESGIGGADASMIARKALYTRATGGAGYVSYCFRQTSVSNTEIDNFAFFDKYLQPKEAVITYSTVIRFLGNAKFIKSSSAEDHIFRDEYSADGHTVYVYYAFGKTANVSLPDNVSAVYDMYGNPVSAGSSISVGDNPVYVII